MTVKCTKYPSISTQIPYKNLSLMKKHIENLIEYEDWKYLIDINLEYTELEDFKDLALSINPTLEIPEEIVSSSGFFRYLVEIVKVDYLVVEK